MFKTEEDKYEFMDWIHDCIVNIVCVALVIVTFIGGGYLFLKDCEKNPVELISPCEELTDEAVDNMTELACELEAYYLAHPEQLPA